MKYYLVWVGGNIVYEDTDKEIANSIRSKYIGCGYDDVKLEIILNKEALK